MRLEWVTASKSKVPLVELKIDHAVLVLRDSTCGQVVYGRLRPIDWPETLPSQLRTLLADMKSEGAKPATLDCVVIYRSESLPAVEALAKELKTFRIPVKLRLLTAESTQRLKVDLQSGTVLLSRNETGVKIVNPKPEQIRVIRTTKILIVEDSLPLQKILTKVYSQIPGCEIVGVESTARGAAEKLRICRPDFVSLDMKLESSTAIEFLREASFADYAQQTGARCVLVTDCSLNEGNLVFDAFGMGASSYVQKPQAAGVSQFADELSELLGALFVDKTTMNGSQQVPQQDRTVDLDSRQLIAVGSSTGGTEVVLSLIAGLPADCPPIMVVQHMPAQFTGLYAERIQRQTGRPTHEVTTQMPLIAGHAYIAHGGQHMVVEGRGRELKVKPRGGEPVNRFRPSVSVLFESIHVAGLSSKTVAIMLTGMGRDGAQEMAQLKNSGAITIGQSKDTCVVYGMPRAAEEAGALCWSSSPDEMIESFRGRTPTRRRA